MALHSDAKAELENDRQRARELLRYDRTSRLLRGVISSSAASSASREQCFPGWPVPVCSAPRKMRSVIL